MQVKNKEDRYGIITIGLHWIMALILVFLLIIGLIMARMPNGLLRLQLFGLHKEFGFLILMLVIVRITWRLMNTPPSLDSLPAWERISAKTVHWAFYGFMFAIPITGWLITSAAGLPASFFGLFVIPNIAPPSDEMRHFYHSVHKWLSYGLIATFTLHVLAALKHHFINKDDILRRMLK